jgi:hypothetical protein
VNPLALTTKIGLLLVSALSLGLSGCGIRVTVTPAAPPPTAVPATTGPYAVLEQAIAAHGGAERLNRLKAEHVIATMTTSEGRELHVEQFVYFPDKVKNITSFEMGGKKIRNCVTIHGDHGWLDNNGAIAAFDNKSPSYSQGITALYLKSLARLTPLRQATHQLSLLPQAVVEGRLSQGIRVVSTGWPVVHMYFDMENGLLLKLQAFAGNNPQPAEEWIFREHQAFQGIQCPTKCSMYSGGQKRVESVIVKRECLEKLNETLFSAP